jgi:putative transcriptional regulator
MTTKRLDKILEKDLGVATFASFMRAARTRLDLTQSEMAKRLGMSKGGICDLEKGRQFVSIELAVKIANKLQLSEAFAIHCVIKDSIRRAGLKYEITIKKSA